MKKDDDEEEERNGRNVKVKKEPGKISWGKGTGEGGMRRRIKEEKRKRKDQIK